MRTHGVNAYANHRCRCKVCRKAWAAYIYSRRHSAGPKLIVRAKHGTMSMYVYHQCRCKYCKIAHHEYLVRRRQADVDTRRNRG